ncbi:hypothetical protein SHIRM173S_06714 [Streptomyces hirsutus]
MARVGEGAPPGHRVVHGVDARRQVDLGEVGLPGAAGGPGRLLDPAGGAEAPGDLVQLGEDLGGFEVQLGQGADGGAQFTHRHRGAQAPSHHVPDDQRGAVSGKFDHVEQVAADLAGPAGRRAAGQVPAGDVEAGRLRVAGREQGPLQYQGAFVLAPVEAGVVDTDGGARGQLHGEVAVAVPERLAALGTGELGEADHRVVGDHRHGERGPHQPALLARYGPRAGGAQGVRARRVERVVVDGAELDGLSSDAERRVGDGAGEGHTAHLRAAVGEARRGLVAGQQPLVEVDGGQVAGSQGTATSRSSRAVVSRSRELPIRAPASLSRARLRRAAAASRAAARRAVMSVASQAMPMGRPLPLCTRYRLMDQ